jgi:hypothetical protein
MDYTLKASIERLRKISIYLFLFTNIALFGTLFAQNFLTKSKFTYNYTFLSGEGLEKYGCNKDNNFCFNVWEEGTVKNLEQCNEYGKIVTYNVDNITIQSSNEFRELTFDKNKKIKPEYKESNIFISYEYKNVKNPRCIKNYKIIYSIHKIFPKLSSLIADIKLDPKYFDATRKSINPFFYGETSISNIAKRYPLYLIFKPLLFIASLLMIFYWVYTKKIIYSIFKSEKTELYYVFGILSGIFLFFHVLFLGSEIQNEIFVKLRRYFVAFFILFELLAQFFLIKKLYSIKKIINNFINYFILQIKLYFIIFFLFLTSLVASLMIFLNIPKELDYIIEWNYFIFLSFYYLLTFFLWKKINF